MSVEQQAGNKIGQADEVEAAAAIKAMRDRGLNNVEELMPFASPVVILKSCAWYDRRRASSKSVTPGLLAKAIREGGAPEELPRETAMEREARYGYEIVDWLRTNFPQWNKDDGNRTHPAAITAVIRLHHRHGKWRLSKGEHGGEIREAVRRFDDMLGEREGTDGN